MIRDESLQTPERGSFFDTLLQIAQEDAMEIVCSHYENQADILTNLDYHNRAHSLLMKSRVTRLLKTMQLYDPKLVTPYDVHIGGLAALYHDTVQNWEMQESDVEGIKIMKRKRFVGQNEWDSAQNLLRFMDRINQEYDGVVYREDDKEKALEAIKVTIPGFDPAHGTIIQPNLTEGVGPITIALALSDLGTAGLSGGLAFQMDGDQLFREENLDVKLATAGRIQVSEEHIRNMRERMLSWSSSQVQFAKGRQALLPHETSFLPDTVRPAIMQLFNRFPQAIDHAETVAQRRSHMSYPALFQDMGYAPSSM